MNPKITSSRIRWRTRGPPSRIRQTSPKKLTRADPTLIQCSWSACVDSRRSDFLVDARGLAGQITQVVELGAPYGSPPLHADFADGGTMGLKHALHAFTVRNLAHRERRVQTAILLRDHHALVGLNALAIT